MVTEIILLYLALLAPASLARSKHAASWERRVSSEDFDSSRPHETPTLDFTSNEIKDEDYRFCESQECTKIALELVKGMNNSIDPCEDFYEYACGGWTENMPIPPSTMLWDHDAAYQNIVHYRLKRLLETKATSNDILPVKQAKKWYRSCMNTDMLHKRGMRPIESLVIQAGGWPMSMEKDEWDAEGCSWQSVDAHFTRLTGIRAFYDVDVNPVTPIEEHDFSEIRIGPSKHLLARDSLIHHKSYKDLISKILDEFRQHNGVTMPSERYSEELEDLIDFEMKLHKLVVDADTENSLPSNQNTARHETNMTFEQFADWYYEIHTAELNEDSKANIDWKLMVPNLFGMVSIKVDPTTPVYVNTLEYFKYMGELLNQTPSRTIVNYVNWNFIASLLAFTSPDLRDFIYKMEYEHFGVEKSEPRWLECTKQMKMTYAAAYIFANKYFTEPVESAALNMLRNVRKAMTENIEKSNWLDEESKSLIIDKLNKMKIFMGIPDWYRNETAVIDYYRGLTIRDDYFDNALSYMRYRMKRNLKRYTNPKPSVDRTTWLTDPLTMNAEYGTGNSLNLPPVNFQPPIFTSGLPDYINYGFAGFTIGHEMGHGFDHKGIKFGKDHNDTELNEDILSGFYQRADCFVKQFEEYFNETASSTSDGDTSSESRGWLTRGENIADTTGLQAVFHAYQKLNRHNPTGDTKLPGLEEFDDNQLFFISYAAAWCGIERPEYTDSKDQSHDPHSPGRFRVIGAVSNSKDFAKVFDCPKGSPMNPSHKCSIWRKPGATRKRGAARRKRKNHK